MNPLWLDKLLEDVLGYPLKRPQLPPPTFCSELLDEIKDGVKNFEKTDSNFTASGVEGFFTDKRDGQKYHVVISSIQGG